MEVMEHKVSFVSLDIGDVFMYNTLLFMKTEVSYNDELKRLNAVRLDGRVTYFSDEDNVTPIKGKFIGINL